MTQADDEARKARDELTVFHKFIQLSELPVVSGSIENGDPKEREPDILCEIEGEGPIAFEITEFVDESLAREFKRILKHPENIVGNPIWAGGVMHVLGNKFTKDYKRACPIDLICYTNSLTLLPPDTLIPQMREYLEYIQQHGQFPPGFDKNPRPEFYLRDGQEWMRFRMDPQTEFDSPATDTHKKEYHKEYKMFKAGKQLPAQTTRTPNKNQFRGVWFMSIQEGEECCERIV